MSYRPLGCGRGPRPRRGDGRVPSEGDGCEHAAGVFPATLSVARGSLRQAGLLQRVGGHRHNNGDRVAMAPPLEGSGRGRSGEVRKRRDTGQSPTTGFPDPGSDPSVIVALGAQPALEHVRALVALHGHPVVPAAAVRAAPGGLGIGGRGLGSSSGGGREWGTEVPCAAHQGAERSLKSCCARANAFGGSVGVSGGAGRRRVGRRTATLERVGVRIVRARWPA